MGITITDIYNNIINRYGFTDITMNNDLFHDQVLELAWNEYGEILDCNINTLISYSLNK